MLYLATGLSLAISTPMIRPLAASSVALVLFACSRVKSKRDDVPPFLHARLRYLDSLRKKPVAMSESADADELVETAW